MLKLTTLALMMPPLSLILPEKISTPGALMMPLLLTLDVPPGLVCSVMTAGAVMVAPLFTVTLPIALELPMMTLLGRVCRSRLPTTVMLPVLPSSPATSSTPPMTVCNSAELRPSVPLPSVAPVPNWMLMLPESGRSRTPWSPPLSVPASVMLSAFSDSVPPLCSAPEVDSTPLLAVSVVAVPDWLLATFSAAAVSATPPCAISVALPPIRLPLSVSTTLPPVALALSEPTFSAPPPWVRSPLAISVMEPVALLGSRSSAPSVVSAAVPPACRPAMGMVLLLLVSAMLPPAVALSDATLTAAACVMLPLPAFSVNVPLVPVTAAFRLMSVVAFSVRLLPLVQVTGLTTLMRPAPEPSALAVFTVTLLELSADVRRPVLSSELAPLSTSAKMPLNKGILLPTVTPAAVFAVSASTAI